MKHLKEKNTPELKLEAKDARRAFYIGEKLVKDERIIKKETYDKETRFRVVCDVEVTEDGVSYWTLNQHGQANKCSERTLLNFVGHGH